MYYQEDTVVYLDGQWISPHHPNCSLYSQSLHYGNGVFEGIRSYETESGARIFRGETHYRRLLMSCEKMHIPIEFTVSDFMELSYELLQRNNLKNAYIRPLVFQHDGMALMPVEGSSVFLAAWEWGRYLGDKLLRVMTSTYERPNPRSVHVEAKVCGHYVNSVLATKEAKQKGYDEGLLLDMNGFVAEGPGANFFLEKDGALLTAPLGNILPGVTRQTIIDLARENEIEVTEEHFTIDKVKSADSAFFTGTAAEVAGLASLDEYEFPLPWERSLGHKLSELYAQEVRKTTSIRNATPD